MARWDRQTDVLVVGCGFAGAMTAIAAHDAGAKVVVLEKMPDPGGISVCSFGGVRVAKSAEAAFAYLKRTNGGTAPDGVLRALAKGMEAMPAQLEALARPFPIELSNREVHGNYPFDGHDTFAFVNVEKIEGFNGAKAYPHVRGAPGGRLMFHFIEMCLAHRGIVPLTCTSAEELVLEKGRVVGLVARSKGRRLAIRAKRGVVLACGGFEGNAELQKQFWPEQPVLNAAFRGNTGDGIRMAQSVGADLWHMWHYHGSYGFRHTDPKYPFGIRTKRLPDWLPGVGPRGDVRMPWILVNRRGRRFTNEYDPYLQDTGARALSRYDPQVQDYAALPAWLIADAEGTRLYPFGRPTSNERGIAYEWSADNEAEIASGILHRASSIDALAQAIGVPGHELASTLEDWNAYCASQRDDDWGRPPSSMMPIVKPPFTYAPVWPIVSNTQGGPVHDARQRVIGANGKPIAGLYAAGELGAVFGHLYLSGGNIAECFVGGRIAGREAALRGRG